MGKTPPICLSLLLCDQVVADASTGKMSILGMFQSVTAAAFPTILPRCAVWIELTNGHGETPVLLRLARATPEDIDGDVLLEIGFTVPFHDPRTVHLHHVSVTGLQLPEEGHYRLGLEAFGLRLFERKIVALRRGAQQP